MNVINTQLAAEKLKKGFPVIFQTDTLPAIGCLPKFSEIIYEIKKRDNDKPLILMGSEKAQFTDYVHDISMTYAGIPSEFDNVAIELSDRSLDGPKAAGIARGDETNKDWYSFAGITLSFRINGNSKGCDY